MSITGLLFSLVLIGLTTLIVVYPFIRQQHTKNTANTPLQQQFDRIQIYYDRVLTNIRDLDEDFNTGKINEADYQQEREVWVHRGIRLLRVQDQLDTQHSLVDPNHVDASSIDQAIEEAIKAYRDDNTPVFHELSQAENTGT